MIDINPKDIVAECRDATNRWVVFTKTDLPPNFPLPYWGVCLDTGGDGHGILVRPTARETVEGWTAAELVHVAHARAVAESHAGLRRDGCTQALTRVARELAAIDPQAPKVTFVPGAGPSVLPWAIASCRGHELPFSPDVGGGEREGITLGQVLIVLDRLCRDWGRAPRAARVALSRAMAACGQRGRAPGCP